MTKINFAALVIAGKELLNYAKNTAIPYVGGGMTLKGMDCQGLVEYLLIKCGVPKTECNLKGSNAHWRAAVWRGTPEECKKLIGKVPAGACCGIHANDGGEIARGYRDSYGNCSHMGLYLGGSLSIAASASRGQVIESNFKGKTVPNGGWNAVFLLPWVDYGLTDAQKAALGIGTGADGKSAETQATTASGPVDVTGFYTIKRGCKGGAVRRLQTWLAALDYTLAVDGDFGPATENAVRYYQRTHYLTEDGIVGPATWAALSEGYSKVGETAKG